MAFTLRSTVLNYTQRAKTCSVPFGNDPEMIMENLAMPQSLSKGTPKKKGRLLSSRVCLDWGYIQTGNGVT